MTRVLEHNVEEPRTAPALEARGYSYTYAGSEKPVLSELSFSLEQGSFTVLCGATGSGKSTLLRAFKTELEVAAHTQGDIRVMGKDPHEFSPVESATCVGFVMQDPESQLVTDTVWHELAFGLENIALEQEHMRRRVAETAHFFGIGAWFDRKVKDLSGGQKQLLNLASVVVMQPQILLLDEPTSQLDPIAAKDFLDVLGRVNDELGITVVIIEHRLEDVLPMADRVLFLESGGTLAYDGAPQPFIRWMAATRPQYLYALPAATQIAVGTGALEQGDDAIIPVTVRQGRTYVQEALREIRNAAGADDSAAPQDERGRNESRPYVKAPATSDGKAPGAGDVALSAHDLWYRYDAESPFVLRGVDFSVRFGELTAIVGGNGSGKSTLLGALAGIRKLYRGSITNPRKAQVALLAQDPKMLFMRTTLIDDMMEWSTYGGYDYNAAMAMLERFGLDAYEKRHPYDLSGGETQKAALAKVLLLDPDILLLDEPVKGVDAVAKTLIGEVLTDLAHKEGKAVLFTSHDLEFVADVAQTCAMMFGCEITCEQDYRGFFRDNLFYSTATSRIARGLLDGCISTSDAIARLTQGALGKGDA